MAACLLFSARMWRSSGIAFGVRPARRFVDLRRLRLTPQSSSEFRLNHVERRFHVRTLVVVLHGEREAEVGGWRVAAGQVGDGRRPSG